MHAARALIIFDLATTHRFNILSAEKIQQFFVFKNHRRKNNRDAAACVQASDKKRTWETTNLAGNPLFSPQQKQTIFTLPC
jgi:hypothetical protein